MMEPSADSSVSLARTVARALIVATWGLQAMLAGAQQPCAGALHKPGSTLPDNDEKFALISQQCSSLAEPAQAHRATLLDIYDRGGSVTIRMTPDDEEAPPPQQPVAATPRKPLDRDAQRVLTLVPALTAAAREHGLDPLLLHAIAHVESRHNALAVSPAGAVGVMQVMPATAKRFGVGDQRGLLSAETNVRAGAAYLRTLRERYGNDLQRVLAAYNAGEGAVDKYNGVPPFPETQAYVRNVIAVYRRLRQEFSS